MRQNLNDDIRAATVLPSVNDPNTLVLQGVKKAARGNYSCQVGNGIPKHDHVVQSTPVFLDVKCKLNHKGRTQLNCGQARAAMGPAFINNIVIS